MDIVQRLAKHRIIPVAVIENIDDTVPLCEALLRADLPCIEITFRTSAGRQALELAASRFPNLLVGAGTVTQPNEVKEAKDAGAAFAVAPGTSLPILEQAASLGLPFIPGVATPSEIQNALQHGCSLLKFFPAEALGGASMLRAISGPYNHLDVRFIPTGGIRADHLSDYFNLPGVVAVGGSWMVAPSLLRTRDWAAVETLAREAVALAGKPAP